MGKKRIAVIGDIDSEEALKQRRDAQREQKKLREAASKPEPSTSTQTPSSKPEKPAHEKEKVHIAGLKGGQRIKSIESTIEAEAEVVARKLQEAEDLAHGKTEAKAKTVVPKKRGKKYLGSKIKVDPTKSYSPDEAVRILKDMPSPKFTPTVELHINCLDKVSAQVELPFSTGKQRVAAAASDEVIEKIQSGKVDFDVLFASPGQMPQLAKLAKILGPRGLMPNPKNGTVVPDPSKAVKEFANSTKINLKPQAQAAVIHTVIGKLNQKEEELTANADAIISAIKTQNIRSVFIKSTMSPSIKLSIV